MTEKQIQNDILREFSSSDLMAIWRANTGVARFGDRVVRFGVAGQADLTGIISGGVRVEVEVKQSSGRQKENQMSYEGMIKKFNGIYILARSVDDVYDGLREAGYEF